MAYVEWHSGVQHHHKTLDLAERLKVNQREAVGIRACLYAWAIENRPGGIIEPELISFACCWPKADNSTLIQALLESKLLDQEQELVKIHDWEEYTRHFRKAQKDAEARRNRARLATVALQQRDYRAEQNRTEQNRGGAATAAVALQTAAPPTPDGAAPPPLAAQGDDEDMKACLEAAKASRIYSASEKQLKDVLTSWIARDGKAAVLVVLQGPTAQGQDILKLWKLCGKIAPFRPTPKPPDPCRRCAGTGFVVNHKKTTATKTVQIQCPECKGGGKAT